MLLTRPPLAARRQPVRLACIRRAASVRPEPGSNSPDEPASRTATLCVRWNHPPAAPSEEKTAAEPVPERLQAPRILTGVIVVSFLLTTLLLLRCGAAYAAQSIRSKARRPSPGDRGAQGQQKTAVTRDAGPSASIVANCFRWLCRRYPPRLCLTA